MPRVWELTTKEIHAGVCTGMSWPGVGLFLNVMQVAKHVHVDSQGVTNKPVFSSPCSKPKSMFSRSALPMGTERLLSPKDV